MSKTLLIVGAGAEQVPAYQAAKARGLTVVGSDMNRDAPAFAWADHRLVASTRDALATLAAARKFAADHPLDGVMTIANDVPYTVAIIAEALGLPGISVEAAKCVTDKLAMKEIFRVHGVACPWFAPVHDAGHLAELVTHASAKRFVIKPIDGRGARGVLLIDSSSDLDWAFAEASRWGDCGRVIIEEFTPGLQLSTESFLIDGHCYTPAIAERNYEFLDRFSPYIIENGGTIPALLSGDLLQPIDDLIAAGAAALGVRDGIVKGDLIITPTGQPVIIELALRLSGGWFATHQIPAASGVSLVDAVISHALGEPVTAAQLTPSHQRATAIRYWFPPAGKIMRIEGERNLQSLPGLIAYGFFRKEGELQPEIRMHPDRFGYLIVCAENREAAIARVNDGLSRIHVEVAS